MEKRTMFTNLAIRELTTQQRDNIFVVEGYGVLWNDQTRVFDYLPDVGYVEFYEQFQRGAFAKSITARAGKDKKNSIKFLLQHNSRAILGTPELIEDERGLKFVCEIERGVSEENDATIKQIETGDLKQISVGFQMQDYSLDKREDAYYVTHTEVKLWELSVVTWSAYENAQIESNRSNIGIFAMINELGLENVRAAVEAMTNPQPQAPTETSAANRFQFNF